MIEENNPYESPKSIEGAFSSEVLPIIQVGQGKRLLNYIIDYAAIYALNTGLGMGIGVVLGMTNNAALLDSMTPFFVVIGLGVYVAYYILFEHLFARTPAKWVTRTIVVNEEGRKPSLGQCVGRSFARLIPFEAFSFLGAKARGWHDSMSNTYVVKSDVEPVVVAQQVNS